MFVVTENIFRFLFEHQFLVTWRKVEIWYQYISVFLAIISHDSAKICMGTPNFFLLILINIIFNS